MRSLIRQFIRGVFSVSIIRRLLHSAYSRLRRVYYLLFPNKIRFVKHRRLIKRNVDTKSCRFYLAGSPDDSICPLGDVILEPIKLSTVRNGSAIPE